jgi:copper oxidase (laccase) domain-containing protein
MSLSPIRADSLDGVTHGFFTRQGGVSTGIYATLNGGQGSNDTTGAVDENRARIAAHLGVGRLVSVHQVHSARAEVVNGPWNGAKPQADAMVTASPGIGLAILTADCAPVLFADRDAGVVGAAHAGWKGALFGVLEATVSAMVGLGIWALFCWWRGRPGDV